MSGLIFFAALAALLALGPRLFVVVGVATTLSFLLFTDYDSSLIQLDRIVTKMESLTGKNVFLSVPFFIAAGSIMTRGGIATRLTALASAGVGFLPGGLAVASILACIVFAAISGSSPVTLVAVGAVMYPALVRSGYPSRFSIGILTSAGSLGCMIPPAITMLIYSICVDASTARVNPSDLFFAGLLPALFIAGLLALYSIWVGLSVPGSRSPFDGAALSRAAREAAWSLTLPAVVLGGIYGGIFTPTEAGAVAFAAALLIACVIHRDVPWSKVPSILVESATLIGSLVLIVILAFGLNDFLAEIDAAGAIRTWVTDAGLSAFQFMLVVNFVLIVLGALMDSISATLVFAPILAPVAINHYGIDPIHFGVVFVVNMEIGYLAPPIATNLFVASAIFRQPFSEVVKSIFPTLSIICGALFVLMYMPVFSTGPLNLREGRAVYTSFPWDGKPAPEAAPGEPAGDPAAAPPGQPMTMEEMKQRARARREAEQNGAAPPDGAAPDGTAPAEGRVLTMEEMKLRARQRAEEARKAEGSAAPGTPEAPAPDAPATPEQPPR